MIQSPNLEIAWGAEWRRGSRRDVEPTIESAINLAVDGFDLLNVPITTSKKIVIRRTVRGFEDAGCSLGDGLIELYLDTISVKRRKIGRMLGLLAVVGLHEMIHDERYNIFPREDLVEFAATEGLASCADTLFARSLLQPHEYPDKIRDSSILTQACAKRMAQDLIVDTQKDNELSEQGDDTLADYWLEEEPRELLWYPRAVIFGSRCVSQRLDEGEVLSEMIHWEPERILQV